MTAANGCAHLLWYKDVSAAAVHYHAVFTIRNNHTLACGVLETGLTQALASSLA